MGTWLYTLADLRTGAELGTFPLTGVKYGLALSGAAPVDAFLPLGSAEVRANQPWASSRPRRVSLFAELVDDDELPDTVMWGGPVWYRTRGSGRQGLVLRGATFESWMARQALAGTLTTIPTDDACDVVTRLLAAVQALDGGDVGMEVAREGNGPLRPVRVYDPRDQKDLLELVEELNDTGSPSEFRVRCYRDTDGRFQKQLLFGQPRLGQRYETSQLTFEYPAGGLQQWEYPEDGTGVSNEWQVAGAGQGTSKPYLIIPGTDVGSDEITAGFPRLTGLSQESQEQDLAALAERGRSSLRASLASESVLTGLKVRHDVDPRLGTYFPGDDLGFSITDLTLETYPEPMDVVARLLTMTVTPAAAGTDTSVELTVGAPT